MSAWGAWTDPLNRCGHADGRSLWPLMGSTGVAVGGLQARRSCQDGLENGLSVVHDSKRAKKLKRTIISFAITAGCWRVTTRWGLKERIAAGRPS